MLQLPGQVTNQGVLFINFIMTCVLQKRGDPIKEETTYTPHRITSVKVQSNPSF